jgi:hypothetical protein
MLRKKDNTNTGRPSSISNAGKQSLARQGYAYEGMTLSNFLSMLDSNVGTFNGGTVDLDKINGRNDARLR